MSYIRNQVFYKLRSQPARKPESCYIFYDIVVKFSFYFETNFTLP